MVGPDPRELPRLVALETTSYCNARCTFCPNDSLARGRRHMDAARFADLVEQCREFPLPAIEPFLQGEPFSDPKIMDRLELIRARLPKTRLRLYTNAAGLTPARVDELARVGVDHLFISLNTLDAAQYRKAMGLGLERTLANVRYLLAPGRRTRVARRITLRMLRLPTTTLAEQDEFLGFCRAYGVRPFISGLFNYKGDVASDLPVPSFPCEHVDRIDVLSDGVVTLCCMDQDGEFAWGDTRRQSLLEIYRGPVARRYRERHHAGQRRSIAPCDRCNVFWPSLQGLPLARRAAFAAQAALYYVRHRPVGRRAPTAPAA